VFSTVLCILCSAACKEEPKDNKDHSDDLGLKVIPAGEKPARAPGPKGAMIEMGTSEVRVVLVRPKSHAEQMGFAAGDIILAAGGKDVTSEDDLAQALKAAKGQKLILELKRGREIYTLPIKNQNPGWLVLSGDTFKGFLLTRLQSAKKKNHIGPGDKAPDLKLPDFTGGEFDLAAYRKRPVVLIFWGTFSEPCYAHMQALQKACAGAKEDKLACVAVDTMELFTAVGKTSEYQAEMTKVHRSIWTDGPMPVDLFMASERNFGIDKLPCLILIGPDGVVRKRIDGPMHNPIEETAAAVEDLIGPAD